MEGYVKAFIGASLFYFMAGALIGLFAAIGSTGPGLLFAHVHLNLLGFMTMMIFGVGYFILPRFNATTIRWPGILPYHFWIANLGLILMIITYSFSVSRGPAEWLFYTGAFSQVVSALLFCTNLFFTMYGRKTPDEEILLATAVEHNVPAKVEEPAPEPVLIDPDMRVGEILERWPESVPLLVEGGLTPLSDSDHVEHIKEMPVTLRMACMRHGGDLEGIVDRLKTLVSKSSPDKHDVRDDGRREEKLPDKSTIIRDVLKKFPETEIVFKKNYGEGCFSCPGQAFESIDQSALMHNLDPDWILEELHRVIRAGRRST